MLDANGIELILRKRNKIHVKKVLNKVDLITLRDKSSVELLKNMGVNKSVIKVTADAVFSLKFNLLNMNILDKLSEFILKNWQITQNEIIILT